MSAPPAERTPSTTHQAGQLWVSPLHPGDVDARFRAQWQALFERQDGPANPFCAPAWVESWYRFFTRPSTAVMLVVRRDDELLAVVPLHLDRIRVGPLQMGSRLVPAGSGQGAALLEQPQPLIAPGVERAVNRLLVSQLLREADLHSQLAARGLDAQWTELPIVQRHGWFEPEWATHSGHSIAFHRHQRVRASVVLPLRGDWETTRTTLKRNVKESLRRSRNRLKKDGRAWEVREHTSGIDHLVVDRFLRLHRARAENSGAGTSHYDAFGDPTRQAFLHQLLPVLGGQGLATVLELVLDGEVVAAQLLLHAPGTTYVHSSGFLPQIWDLGPTTFLQGWGIEAAAERGEQWVNMSPGPNVAKLRWSEQLDVTHDWSFGAGSAALAGSYGFFAAAAAQRELLHQIHMAAEDGGDA